ncbi:MAG: hypothetical protein ACRDMV_15305 [Streptosporangiales bacterium]
MATNSPKKAKTYSLAQYRAEAFRPPFVLDLGDGEMLTIQQPTTDALLDARGLVDDQGNVSDPRAALKALAGDSYDDLMAQIGPEPPGVLAALVRDLNVHFKLGEAGGSPA